MDKKVELKYTFTQRVTKYKIKNLNALCGALVLCEKVQFLFVKYANNVPNMKPMPLETSISKLPNKINKL